jgi:hypothetical protein
VRVHVDNSAGTLRADVDLKQFHCWYPAVLGCLHSGAQPVDRRGLCPVEIRRSIRAWGEHLHSEAARYIGLAGGGDCTSSLAGLHGRLERRGQWRRARGTTVGIGPRSRDDDLHRGCHVPCCAERATRLIRFCPGRQTIQRHADTESGSVGAAPSSVGGTSVRDKPSCAVPSQLCALASEPR